MSFQSSLLLDGIKTSIVSPKGLLLDTSKAAVLELTNESNELIGLTVGGKVVVQKGSIIELNREDTLFETPSTDNPIAKCKVASVNRYIAKNGFNYNYEVLFFKLTLCNLFMLPLLQFKRLEDLNLQCLVNSYVAVDGVANMEDIYLLYRYNYALTDFDEVLTRTPGFAEHFDVHYDYVLYKFKLQQEHRVNMYNFLDGKYSEFTPEAKKKIMDFHGYKKGGGMYNILHRTPEARMRLEKSLSTLYHKVQLPESAELFSRPDIENETLNTSTFNELS